MRLLLASLLVVLSASGNSAVAQQASSSLASSNSAEVSAYRILFRQTLLYKKLADEADSTQHPKPHLRHILATRYELSEDDSASLERMAIAYQAAIKPIRDRTIEVIKAYRARFPFNVIRPGMDTTPPPELADLRAREDAVTLLYRDLLHNNMREADFQSLNTKLAASLGK